VNSFNKINGFL